MFSEPECRPVTFPVVSLAVTEESLVVRDNRHRQMLDKG